MERLSQLKTFLENDPKDPFLLFAIAKEYEKQSDLESAETYYKKILEVDPDYVGLYYHYGKLKVLNGDFAKAIDLYDKGMKVAKSQSDQHAYSELAGAKLEIDDD